MSRNEFLKLSLKKKQSLFHIFHSDVADFCLNVNEYNEVNFDFRYNRVSLEIIEID